MVPVDLQGLILDFNKNFNYQDFKPGKIPTHFYSFLIKPLLKIMRIYCCRPFLHKPECCIIVSF